MEIEAFESAFTFRLFIVLAKLLMKGRSVNYTKYIEATYGRIKYL